MAIQRTPHACPYFSLVTPPYPFLLYPLQVIFTHDRTVPPLLSVLHATARSYIAPPCCPTASDRREADTVRVWWDNFFWRFVTHRSARADTPYSLFGAPMVRLPVNLGGCSRGCRPVQVRMFRPQTLILPQYFFSAILRTIEVKEGKLLVDGNTISVYQIPDPSNIPWGENQVAISYRYS